MKIRRAKIAANWRSTGKNRRGRSVHAEKKNEKSWRGKEDERERTNVNEEKKYNVYLFTNQLSMNARTHRPARRPPRAVSCARCSRRGSDRLTRLSGQLPPPGRESHVRAARASPRPRRYARTLAHRRRAPRAHQRVRYTRSTTTHARDHHTRARRRTRTTTTHARRRDQ